MIQFDRASRWYGQVIGVNDVSFKIGPGVTALLGQNGAGKSTMMRMITGQLRPTTGTVKVFDEDPFANPSVYSKLGYCPDIDNFPEHLSGRQFVYRMPCPLTPRASVTLCAFATIIPRGRSAAARGRP